MQIHVTTADGLPIYQQIVNQVKYLVASGRLQPHEELPPVRTLAEQLLINPNTVARAYRELEIAGILYKRQGAGTYVAEGISPFAEHERRRVLSQRADSLLVEARQMGFSLEQVIALVREREVALSSETVNSEREA